MKIGYIGSGAISNFHIPAIKSNGIEISGIASRKGSIRCREIAKIFDIENAYLEGGWEEILSRDFDAYYICVEVNSTFKILSQALEKNKPIFVEKPINWRPESIKQLLKHKNSKNVFVGFNRRYYETTTTLKSICKNSKGGTIFVNIPESDYGIKEFINNGCHMIDLLRYLINDFEILKSLIKTNQNKDNIDSISAICKNNKWNILLNSHSKTPSNFSITINSDGKVFELKPIEKLSIYEKMKIIEPSPEEPIRKYIPNLKKSFLEISEFKPGFKNMHRNFKLFANKKESQNCTLEDTYNTLKSTWELINCEISKNYDFNK